MGKALNLGVLLIAFCFGGACSRMDEKQLTVGKVTYAFPEQHVFRFTDAEAGHRFARIRPPGQNFDLIYSEFLQYNRNWQSADTPLVAGINNRSASKFTEFDFAGGKTVCREGGPHFTCGLSIVDDKVPWSVVFDNQQVGNSEGIRAAALQILRSYRS